MRYLKTVDFPIHLMVYWWLLWIFVASSELNEFSPPSADSLAQYLLLIGAFVLGHMLTKRLHCLQVRFRVIGVTSLKLQSAKVRRVLVFASYCSLLILLLSLKFSGAYDLSFVEYYTKVRVLSGSAEGSVTGNHILDVLTKILVFPLSYLTLVISLAVNAVGLRKVFIASIVNFCCISYLWQINYPLIYLFWIFLFYIFVTAQRQGWFDKKLIVLCVIISGLLIASSLNRFAGEILGAIRHYIINYHLIGFSIYDSQYQDVTSLLHKQSFGRSSLGFLEQVFENLLKPLEIGFQAASSENAEFLDTNIDIGAHDQKLGNAFGTIIFSFYRDFNLIGIFIGGFLYGALVTYTRYRSSISWKDGALFYMLASAWMTAMMVSPLEAPYFWFVIVAVNFLSIMNRAMRVTHTTINSH